MTAIDRISQTAPLTGTADLGGARSLAGQAIETIGERLLAWSGAISGSGAPAGGFQPDTAELVRGGDVYGLRELSGQIGDRLGASPTEQGELLRAIEDFARAAAVEVHGLAGSEAQAEGIGAARDAAVDAPASEGVQGLVQRLETATASLVQRHGS